MAMTPRKFERNKLKSAMAKAKEQWKAHCKAERKLGNVPVTFESWLGIDERKRSANGK